MATAGFVVQCSGGSLLRTPGRSSFRPEEASSSSCGVVLQTEPTAAGAVALLPQLEDLDHSRREAPEAVVRDSVTQTEPDESEVLALQEFEEWQARARTMMHAYAAAAAQFFLRVAFVSWASKWQRPGRHAKDSEAEEEDEGCAEPEPKAQVQRAGCARIVLALVADANSNLLQRVLLAWRREANDRSAARKEEQAEERSQQLQAKVAGHAFLAWSYVVEQSAMEARAISGKERLLSWSQGRSAVRGSFAAWRAGAAGRQRERHAVLVPLRRGADAVRSAFACWSLALGRLRRERQVLASVAWRANAGRSTMRATFACWSSATAQLRRKKRLLEAAEIRVERIEGGDSTLQAAFACWSCTSLRLRRDRQLLESVSLRAEAGLSWLLWAFKDWQLWLQLALSAKEEEQEEEPQELLSRSLLAWSSVPSRKARLELRSARVSEASWKDTAAMLFVLNCWHSHAQRLARIWVSLSAGSYAFQRLVLSAWRQVPRQSGPSRQFITPRRSDDARRRRDARTEPIFVEPDSAKAHSPEVHTKVSHPRTLLEQLHWKAAQFSQPNGPNAGKSEPRRKSEGKKEHPKYLPTPNRSLGAERRAKECQEPPGRAPKSASRPRNEVGSGRTAPVQLHLKLQDLQDLCRST
mmetsp:Transcript_50018/g.119450  ORF Transcript_50018/g.119450 Transcript_50018/m.119450 type:complete len:639 (+) Transcript_50018:28-1944(+)